MSDAPYILGIAGSPRRHGNSEQMLDACLSAAEEVGASTRKLVVVDYGLRPCLGCNACSSTGECVQRDRMGDVYDSIDGAAALVVASPVYFATVPAVLKTLYDRLQPYWARRYVLKEPVAARRPGALLLVRGGGDPYGFQAAAYTTKSVFAVLGIDVVAEVKIAGVDSPSDIGRHPEALVRAREAGVALANEVLRDAR